MVQDKISISVIIPVYNESRFISECLNSVVSQTLRNIEIICVDDGSEDKSLNILKCYSKNDNRIKVLEQEHYGVSSARNNGMKIATGEYIAFLDADDFYPYKNTLELLFNKATENKANICGGSFSQFINNKELKTEFNDELKGYSFENEGWINYSDYQFDFGYHRFLYKKDFLSENGIEFPDFSRYQDPVFFVNAMIMARKFYALKEITYCYRSGHQLPRIKWDAKKWSDQTKGINEVLKIAKNNNFGSLYNLTIERGIAEAKKMVVTLHANEENYNCLRELNEVIASNDSEMCKLLHLELETEIDLVKKKTKTIESVLSSKTYKFGKIITLIPRKIKSFLNKVTE